MPRQEPLLVVVEAEDETVPFDTGCHVEINDLGLCILRVPSYAKAAEAFQLLADYFNAKAG